MFCVRSLDKSMSDHKTNRADSLRGGGAGVDGRLKGCRK